MPKTILLSLLLAVLIATANTNSVHAGAWGEAFAAASAKQAWETMEKQIWEAAEVAAKQAAVMIINDSIQMLMTGNNGKSLVISNPQDYLFGGPKRDASAYMDNFFSVTARGRDSEGNYHAFGSTGAGGKMSYEGQLVNGARASLGMSGGQTKGGIDLRSYCPPNPKDVFGDGNFRCFSAITSNPYNNPYGYNLAAQSAYSNQYQKSAKAAESVFVANKGIRNIKDSKGNVITPGSFVFEVQVGSLKLPLDMLANADGAAAATIMQAAATSIITSTIQQGIGYVASRVSSEINKPLKRIHDQVVSKIPIKGPQIQFNAYDDNSNATAISSGNNSGSITTRGSNTITVGSKATNANPTNTCTGTCRPSSGESCEDDGDDTLPGSCGSGYICCGTAPKYWCNKAVSVCYNTKSDCEYIEGVGECVQGNT